jgi:hypothetical protein
MIDEKTDWEEILELPEGVYRVKYHQLSLKTLRTLRSRWTSELWKLRREVGYKQDQVRELKAKIRQKEEMLTKMSEQRLQSYIESEKRKEQQAETKALAFLEEYIGTEKFEMLQTEGHFTFEANGKEYRIKKDGRLQEANGKYWSNCCVISKDLPLPDFIACVFTAVHHDKQFHRDSIRSKTSEEVTQ